MPNQLCPGLEALHTVAINHYYVQHLSESINQQHITNNQLLTLNQKLENLNQQLVESNQQLIIESKNTGKKKAGSKNVSNEHVLLKNEHVLALGTVKPLLNGEPFKVTDNNKRIWHPNLLGKVENAVNAKFIHEIAQYVWNNEKSLRENKNLKLEIDGDDFDLGIITNCVKIESVIEVMLRKHNKHKNKRIMDASMPIIKM
ncbi:hypothetical protein BDR07DRAFT_1381261 [Suillus spraguei]|nr:hypothetical protein BDR07DRAFT_1381261 [Suillus spraguei]